MRNKRKLLGYYALARLAQLSDIGVPTSKLIRDANLEISRPHLAKLLSYFTLSTVDPIVERSLFPAWVDPRIEGVQEQPVSYKYKGVFPYGKWERQG